MGIDVNCKQCHKWLGKQCFCYRAELLDALRAYLKNNKEKHRKTITNLEKARKINKNLEKYVFVCSLLIVQKEFVEKK